MKTPETPEFTVLEGADAARLQAAGWYARMRADDVDDADRQQWQAWLAQDPSHRRAYEQLDSLWSSLGEFSGAPEITHLLRQMPPAPRRTRARAYWLGGVAACLALVAAWFLAPEWPSPPSTAEYRTGLGERRSLQLQDGSQVDLDADTRLQVRYDRTMRHITLIHGRAFFRVAKDPAHPFEVGTAIGGVRTLGTQFEVARRTGALDVALYEGRVALLSKDEGRETAQLLGTLEPGQQARLDGRHMQLLAQGVMRGSAPKWLSGQLVFNDTALSDAVEDFNRYSAQPLRLADPAIGQLRISGVFRGEDAEGFAEALQEVYGLRETHAADGAHVLSNAP